MLSKYIVQVPIKTSQYLYLSRRCVSTWSPLGTAFNTIPGKRINFKLLQDDVGLFGIDKLKSPIGFYAWKDQACIDAELLVKESCSPNRQRKIVDIFDEMSDTLCRVADLAEFIRIAHPKAAYREAAEDASCHIANTVEELNTNIDLYNSLKCVVENGDIFPTTAVDYHVAKLFLFDFEQSGIHLSEDMRKRVVVLNEAALNLGQHFVMGSSKPISVSKSVLPTSFHSYFTFDGDNLTVNSLHSECSVERIREAAYKIYLHPDPHQEFMLQELLKTRRELAQTCGFSSFAERAIRGTTAETPAFVETFLETLNRNLRPYVEEDMKYLLEYKKKSDPSADIVQAWDITYLTAKVKNDFLMTESTDVSEFFSLGACMEGLNHLTQSLFGISLVYEDVDTKEVWATDVYKLSVEHETEGVLGHIYCDFYRRPGKPQQDCHFTIRGGRLRADGVYQTPIVVLMLNLHAPRWSGPCLLSLGQLENLAHEMGHALHSMIARTKHQHVTGTRCATDFAEVPSILMEYFISDPRVLKVFTKHFQTKDSMPDDSISKLCQSKNLLSATDTQTQILYAMLDQRLHCADPLKGSTTDLFLQLQESYSTVPPVKNTGWQLRFSHLVGYGARYYSYLLSRSVASCIWQRYFAADPFSRAAGEKYKQDCLSHGGGKPPRKLLEDFLGQEVQPQLMADALVSEMSLQYNSQRNTLQ